MDHKIHYERAIISKDSYAENFNSQNGKNLYWTDNANTELPVIISPADEIPLRTLSMVFK